MMEDTPEKLQYLKSFSRWIDYGCRPAPGLAGSFKVDGGAFHHRNNYPAYAVGGLDGATNMIYLFSRTSLAVSELAHRTVKDVLLAMRFYCNKLNFPLSMSGRHPDGKGKLVPMHYAIMAIAGTPDGKGDFDKEMASVYLRLVSSDSFSAEQAPEYGSSRNLPAAIRWWRESLSVPEVLSVSGDFHVPDNVHRGCVPDNVRGSFKKHIRSYLIRSRFKDMCIPVLL